MNAIDDALTGAIWAARRGWKVHPCNGKVPTTQWADTATDDVEVIVSWFAGASLNYGIACGPSGLLVVDDDDQGNALARYADSIGQEIPDTLTVATGRGLHYFFRQPATPVGCSSGNLPPGIDVKGAGGYVIGPGSRHSSGATYAVIDADAPILDPPAWLLAAVTAAPEKGRAALPYLPPDVIPVGQRHQALVKYAARLRHRHLDLDEALVLVRQRWQRCAQPDGDKFDVDKAEAIVKDVYARYTPDTDEADDLDTGLTLVRADTVTPRDTKWLVPNYIPRGHPVVLVGDEGIGKGLWWCRLIATLTKGPEAIDVIVIVAEDDHQEAVAPRLIAAGADSSRVHYLVRDGDTMTGVPVIPGETAQVKALIEDTGAQLVIIDPWASVVPGRLQLKDTQQARQALDPVTKLARETDAAFLLVAHTNRTGSGDTRNLYGSTVALRQVPRVALMALPDPNDPAILYVGVDKSNLGPEPPAVRYRKTGAAAYWHVEDSGEPVGLTIKELVGILSRDGDARVSDKWTAVALSAGRNGGLVTRQDVVEAYDGATDSADKAIARWRNCTPPRLRPVPGKRGVFEVMAEPPASTPRTTPHYPHFIDTGGVGGNSLETPRTPRESDMGGRGVSAGGNDQRAIW